MTKETFLGQLRKGLSGLPQDDIEERLAFYSEMIDDRMEEGLSEEEAVSQAGNIDEIIAQIIADVPLTKLVKESVTPKKKMKAWEIALLVLGSPVWLSLLIAAGSVALAVYASLWSVIISLWAVFGALAGCAFGATVAGAGFAAGGNALVGAAMIGAGFVCAGLAIFAFYGCKAATKAMVWLTKRAVLWIKNCFVKKEAA